MNKGWFPKLWYVLLINLSRSRYIPRNFHRSMFKAGRIPTTITGIARPLLAFAVPPFFVVKALFKKEEKQKEAADQQIILTADELYEDGQYEKLYLHLVEQRGSENPEVLWRLARATFERSRPLVTDIEKLEVLEEAFVYVTRALEIDDNCWAAHKWSAILMDYVWRYKSTKGRITHSFDVRKHMERAIELNPKDSTSYYLLGEWCYTFADMPWYQRKAASVIFASPPTSTFEEAHHFFEIAEKNSPLFYSMNLLMMAKCLLHLNQKERAIKFLKQALDYEGKTPDDLTARSEAAKLLKELGVKTE